MTANHRRGIARQGWDERTNESGPALQLGQAGWCLIEGRSSVTGSRMTRKTDSLTRTLEHGR